MITKSFLMFSKNFTFTKRQVGIIALLSGFLGLVGVFLFDSLGISDPQGGFGPSQKMGLIGAILLMVIGITLIPLGDAPA